MPGVSMRLQNFSGEVPRAGVRVLTDANAQIALNTLLTSGALEPLYSPLEVSAVLQSDTVKSVYRMYDSSGNSYWLNWTSDVDVARLPIGGDTTFRSAFTSEDFEPRITNLAMASSITPYPGAWYVLGVTPPLTKPTIGSVTGGTAPVEDRSYVYTFVTQWGEESAPSPAATVFSGNANGDWNLTGLDTAPPNSGTISATTTGSGTTNLTFNTVFGLRVGEMINMAGSIAGMGSTDWRITAIDTATKIVSFFTDTATVTGTTGTWARVAPHNTTSMKKRIYRSVTAGGSTTYYYVGEVAVATTIFTDLFATALGEPIATVGWNMPPADMQHVQSMPSGCLVGFSGNKICFSEPYSIYAWPAAYQLVLDYPIVGIGTYGDTVIAATKGQPYAAQGTDPATMTETKVDVLWPCMAKRGVVSMGFGVAYPTPQGLALISPAGPTLLTDALYTFREWALAAPTTFIAAIHDNRYYAGYTAADATSGMLILDNAQTTAVSRSNVAVSAIYNDKQDGKMYIVSMGKLYVWNANNAERMPMDWWSKEFVVPTPVNLGAAKIDADFSLSPTDADAAYAAQIAQIAANAARIAAKTTGGAFNGSSFNTYSLNGSAVIVVVLGAGSATRAAQISIYVNGVLYYSTTRTSSRAFRLRSGTKYDTFSIRVSGNVPIKGIVVAETMDDLRGA